MTLDKEILLIDDLIRLDPDRTVKDFILIQNELRAIENKSLRTAEWRPVPDERDNIYGQVGWSGQDSIPDNNKKWPWRYFQKFWRKITAIRL